jgi:deoxyadenosine/deoxycytidine kinase
MSTSRSNLVYVAGNIAAGKSTVSNLLGKRLGASVVEEAVESNPYLGRFYGDTTRWSFTTDMHFLIERCRTALAQFDPDGPPVILDRCYLEGKIFADVAYRAGAVTTDEHRTFINAFEMFDPWMPAPAALIALHAPTVTLTQRVQRRGRPFEERVSTDYLDALEARYAEFFDAYDRSPMIEWDTASVDGTELAAVDAVAATVRGFLT